MPAPALVVMAAGIGSRYGGLKQIDPVGPQGEIIIDYSVYDALRAGFGKIVFIIRRDLEQAFREKVGKRIEHKADVRYVFQELSFLPKGFPCPPERRKPWGTGHAVLLCRDVVDGAFAVVNADDFYGAGSYKSLGSCLRAAKNGLKPPEYCLVGYVLKNTLSEHGHVARGVCEVTPDGWLREIHERKKIVKEDDAVKFTENDADWTAISPESTVSMNMWGFTPDLFDELEGRFPPFLRKNLGDPKSEFLLPEIVGGLVREKKAKVGVIPTSEKWIGVTYQEDKPVVQAAVKALVDGGKYPSPLWG